jgi:hypothetical protein
VKMMRSILAIVLVMVFAACSYNDGACWLPDSQGEGVGAGGPIIAGGVGGYGETPPGGGGYGAGYIPCPEQEPTPLGELTCAPSNWGANCHASCLSYGALCYPVVENYITKRQNVLWKCCNCNPGQCWYIDRTDPNSGCKVPTGAEPPMTYCWSN